MTHEEFYNEVVAVKDKNYGDPSDFANDILALLGKFRVEHAAQQSVQSDGNKLRLDGTFPCPECHFKEKHLASCSRR